MKIAFITTCMDRLEHAKLSSRAILDDSCIGGGRNFYVFVDFACPQNSGNWIEKTYGPRANVVRLNFDLPEDEEVIFHKSLALNRGAMRARELGADYFIFMDADFITTPDFQDMIHATLNWNPHRSLIMLPPKSMRDLSGFLGVPMTAFFSLNGFDQNMVGWGAEDLDMRVRLLLAGLPSHILPHTHPDKSWCYSLTHGDDLRLRHSPFKTTQESHRYNLQFLDKNVQRITGLPLREYLQRPHGHFLRPMLGLAPQQNADSLEQATNELEENPNEHVNDAHGK